MKITEKILNKHGACDDGIEWFKAQSETELQPVVDSLMAQDKFSWANWLVVRFLSQKQKIQYAVFAAELVIDIYEQRYPGNDKPRKAIEAAKAVIKRNTASTRSTARNAANAADAAAYAAAYAAYAAYAADAAAYAAAYAAYAAANAAYAAYAAAYAAYAADAAAYAADAANAVMTRIKKACIEHGLKLLGGKVLSK